MHLFFSLLFKITPLYALILLGYISGKKLKTQKETIASLLIYVIVPVVIFNSIATSEIKFELLLLPLIFLILCCFMCLLFYYIGGNYFKDSTRNILAFAVGSANTGYFGVPVAIELIGPSCLGIVILCILGFTLYENSLGFFITAKGNHSASEAVTKLLRLPTVYVFFAALVVNKLGINLGYNYITFAKNFIGAYTILGMMLIGMGLADIKSYKFDFKFVLATTFAKFVLWPAIILLLVFLDRNILHYFNETVYKVMVLISIVPLAANTVAFATELKAQPEKASLAVFISTLIALVYIPFFTTIIFKF